MKCFKQWSDFVSLYKPGTFDTVMTLSLRTDRSGQTVQTQIRLLLEEQSDQGLHCLLFHLHLFDKIPKGLASFLEFLVDYSNVFWRPKILRFMNPHKVNWILQRSPFYFDIVLLFTKKIDVIICLYFDV